jgi:hypothetical protein
MGRYYNTLLIFFCVFYFDLALSYPTPVDFDGTLLRWDISRNDPPILYEINATNESDAIVYQQAVVQAAEMWNDVSSSYFFYAQAAEGESAQVTINLESALTDAPFSAGYAMFDEMTTDGKPIHCNISIGLNVHNTSLELAKTVMHELGHCLGLGHSLIPEAIMGYQLEKNNFELDIDDQAAISRLYPADGSDPALPPGCSIGFGRDKNFFGLFLLFLPMMFLTLQRTNRFRPW